MKQVFTNVSRKIMQPLLLLALAGISGVYAQGLPELLYFKFDGTGSSVTNEASAPVVSNGTIIGAMSQGGNGLFNGGLIGANELSNNARFTTNWRLDLSGSWTIGMYVKDIANQGFTQVYLLGSSNNSAPNIRMYTNSFTMNSVTLAIAGATPWTNISFPMTTGSDFYVHVVHDASANQIRIFRDGVQVAQGNAPAGLSLLGPTGSELLVGGHVQSATVGRSIGAGTLIDEFRMYNRALDATEIALTYNVELPLAAACPLFSGLSVTPGGVDAVVDWVPGSGNTGYHFEYGTQNFVRGTGTVVSGTYTTGVPPLTITGLNPLTTYDYYFYEVCNNGFDTSLVGSGNFTTLVACPAPTNFAFGLPSTSGIGFSWTSLGSDFQIEYGLNGFAQGTGTLQPITGLSGSISGLLPNTRYDVYLRQNCGALGSSTWEGPFTFITQCGTENLPYVQNFDDATWVVGVNAAHTGSAINNCWDRSPDGSGYFWGPKSLPTVTRNSGPNKAFNGSNYIFAVANNGSAAAEALLTSPAINLVGAVNPVLRFYYHMFGSQMGSLVTEVNNGSGWVAVNTISGQQQTTEFDPWRLQEVALSAYVGDTIQVRMKAIRGGGANSDIAIDAFSVTSTGACPAPAQVVASGPQFGQLVVSWPATAAGNYEVEWGPENFFQGTGLNNTSTSDTFLIVNGPVEACYLFRVRSVCGGVFGSYSSLFKICQDCLYPAPYLETFEGNQWVSGAFFNNNGSAIDSCWSRTPIWQGANIFFWGTRTGTTSTGNTGPNGDHTFNGNGKYVFAVGYGTGGDEAYLISPWVDLSLVNRPAVSYFYHLAGGQIGSVRTEVQRLGETTWTVMDQLVGAQQSGTNDPWLERQVPIYNFAGDTVRFRMAAVRGAGVFNTGDHALDDFSVFDDTSCTVPGSPTLVNVTATSATVRWTANGFNDFRLIYSEAPFNAANAITQDVTGDSAVIAGLNPESSYVFYMVTRCDSTTISDTSQVLLFNTGCLDVFPAPYFQGFENNKWTPGTGSANANAGISSCWSRTANNTSYRWGSITGPSQSTLFPFTGPLGAFDGDKYIIARNAGLNTVAGDQTTITSPSIDVSTLAVPVVKFFYHMHGANMGSLRTQINDGTGWRTIDSIGGFQQLAQTDPWLERYLVIGNIASDTIQVRLLAVMGGQYADIAIDNFEVIEGPPCVPPADLVAAIASPTSVNLSWIINNPDSMEVAYGSVGFNPGTVAGTTVGAGNSPFVLTGLTPGICYDIYVRNNCTANGDSVSAWIGPEQVCMPMDFDLRADFLIASNATCGDSALPVALVVTNNGFGPETGFGAGAILSSGGATITTLTFTYTGTLNPGQTDTLALGTVNTAAGGNFFLQAFANLSNDADRFNDTISRLLFTVDLNPVAITQTPDTICGTGTMQMIKDPAFAANVGWFDANNNLLATGDTFTTPVLTTTTNYIVRGITENGNVGPINNTFGNNAGFFSNYAAAALEFTTNKWMTIDSVTIYPEGPGVVNVVLRTNPGDSLANSRLIEVPASFTGGAFRAALGMPVLPGNWRLAVSTVGTTVTGLGRTSTNAQYPYTFGSDVSITGNNLNEAAIYYYFYNWRITVGDICNRPDAQVTAVVSDVPNAAFTFNSTPGATGFTVDFDAATSTGGNQFSWNFGDGNSGSGAQVQHIFTANGSYTVTLIVSNSCGSDTITQTVVVAGISVPLLNGGGQVRLYPNPAVNSWRLEGAGLPNGAALFTLTDLAGRSVLQRTLTITDGKVVLDSDASTLPAGTYMVVLAGEQFTTTLRLVVSGK